MRILQVNKFFYRRGGAEVVFLDTIEGLRQRGHEVSEFSMVHPKNLPSAYSAYFASEIPELQGKHDSITSWRIFKRLFYSSEIIRKLNALVLAAEPEVAHLHNVYHHLSASTFVQLKRMNIPMVLTVHDVFPLCPNHSLLHGETMAEELFKGKLYNCIRYACVNNRLLPSIAGTLEAYYYRLRRIWQHIALYVCPSQFMADKLVEWGFPRSKVRVVVNPFIPPAEDMPPLGTKIVYLGRLHYEKGIKIFMQAAQQLRQYQIVVAGSGPEEGWVDEFVRRNGLSHVERIGWVNDTRWEQIMAEAKVIVAPSVFYENCSLSILESLSYGRLVVASNRGGTKELVQDGITGFLAQPEDPNDLVRVITKAMQLPAAEAMRITQKAREMVLRYHQMDDYLTRLEQVYHEALLTKTPH